MAGLVAVTAIASDNVQVASVRFTVDGRTIAVRTSAPYVAALNFKVLTPRSHVVSAVATDSSGNTAVASIVVFGSGAADRRFPVDRRGARRMQ
jgi:hypothetical protein